MIIKNLGHLLYTHKKNKYDKPIKDMKKDLKRINSFNYNTSLMQNCSIIFCRDLRKMMYEYYDLDHESMLRCVNFYFDSFNHFLTEIKKELTISD